MEEQLRKIVPSDNIQIAELIRSVMTEFGCVGEGYSITDPEVDNIYESYSAPRHCFWVIENSERILGCGGIGNLVGADENICELKKMYFYPELRGKGWGRKLIEICLAEARTQGYKTCYLETVSRMESAVNLYRKVGFRKIENQMGNTGHSKCETYFAIEIG